MSTEKEIEKLLRKALLLNGEMSLRLYEHDLVDQIEEWKQGMINDGDGFVFALDVNNREVAMVLITKNFELFINEKARDYLQTEWPLSYNENIAKLIPSMAEELANDGFWVTGVKTKDTDN